MRSSSRSAEPPLRRPSPSTRAVHAGEGAGSPRPPAGAAIYQTAPFVFTSVAELAGAFQDSADNALYSRQGNPTVRVAEVKLAALEGAQDAVAFASGMGAISAVLAAHLASGDRLLAAGDLYGGSLAHLAWLAERQPEIAVDVVPLGAVAERLASGEAPRMVLVESPSNPLLACCDLAALAALTAPRGTLLVVDNTFATPVLQNPLALGADLVVHSASKYLGGHSDVTAGFVAGRAELLAPLRKALMLGGACLDPHAAFLLARGMKTLELRILRQSENAARLAAFLRAHPAVAAVHYPGDDPVARGQMKAGGGMLACELRGGAPALRGFVERLALFRIIPSLGGVESGVSLPALTSHRHLSAAERAALGIGDSLVRLSVGIEGYDDLDADLAQALAAETAVPA